MDLNNLNPVEIQKYLKGINYPINKTDLIKAAQSSGAEPEIIDVLQKMPGDHFGGPNEVTQALSQVL
ncbi:DUF2795 domain-containing protein [Patescibacteria group bacterium]|nr:DUF2795 domain-containing protein [Patescibacteria group bacterium]